MRSVTLSQILLRSFFVVVILIMLVVLWRTITSQAPAGSSQATLASAEGTVIAVEIRDNNGERLFYPIVEFRTPTGATIRVEGEGERSLSYQVGDRVEVVYDPEQPTLAVMRSSNHWSALAIALCLIVLVIAMMVLFWQIRKQRLAQMTATEGIVVGAVQYDDGESNLFYPLVEFQTAAGETIRFRGNVGTAFAPPYKTGARVKVYYNPAMPQSAIIDR
ncbi:MAG: DUF3592 domain-containing protein [Chloroflexus sp.]|nr:DUF3592 domain-containing protein [Chloroflexus sp.]